ncbi:MAG: hypothetical protein IR153_07610 [Flavobacterium sp.]|nr:hypothetical protein [Flavobacterium sp.]
MKTLVITIAFLSSGLSSYKEMPSPIWYSLSKKILVETQRLIGNEQPAEPIAKKNTVVKRAKVIKVPLKCQQSKESKIQSTIVPTDKDTLHEI